MTFYRVYIVDGSALNDVLLKSYKTLASAKRYVEKHTPKDWYPGTPYYRVSCRKDNIERFRYRYYPNGIKVRGWVRY